MNGFVKCAISNFNGAELSNPKNNSKKINELVRKASSLGASILVLPELCITGYTCQDLFGTSDLLNSSLNSLKELLINSHKYSDILTLVGCPINVNDSLYNCAVVIHGGRILGVFPKQFIPNNNEFY